MRKVFGWRSMFVGAVVAGVAFAACYPEPSLIVQPPATVKAPARKVSGIFINAKTNQLITTELKLTVRDAKGNVLSGVRDTDGHATSTFTTTNGTVGFIIDPSVAVPLDVSVVAQGAGYITGIARVNVPGDGMFEFVQPMVEIAKPPDGVVAVQASIGTTDATGKTTAPATVSTPAEPNTGAKTAVTLPANTVVTGVNGSPLVGALTATVMAFENQSDSSLAAFPGGFDVTIPASGTSTTTAEFVSAGFTAIQIADSTGNLASTFSNPITIAMTVPSTTTNPETTNIVQVGETIPFWSLNENTGVWSSEGDGTFAANANTSLFDVTRTVTHLSYFNLDWRLARCIADVVITGNTGLALAVELKAPGGGFYRVLPIKGTDDGHLHLNNAPKNLPLNITVRFDGTNIGNKFVSNLCTGGTISLPVTPPAVTPASIRAHVYRACETDPSAAAPLPGVTVTASPSTPTPGVLPRVTSTDVNGDAVFSGLNPGANWTITADGLAPVEQKLASGLNVVNFSQIVSCQVVSGASGGP